jgi:thiosulfate dehydrogenase
MARGILWGMILTLMLGAVGGYLFIVNGGMPANADSPPSALETWMAHKSLRASIQREAPQGAVAMQASDANVKAGIKLYAQNCMVCHGASDGVASNIALGLFQEAPQLAKDGVEDDPEGKIYWKVKHGIRLTGMPSFSKTLKDEQVWQVTLFLKHMDSLSPQLKKEWDSLPSAGPSPR